MKRAYISQGQLVIRCPGCSSLHAIPIEGPKRWDFNGSLERPTIAPSLVLWTEDFTDPEDPSFHIPGTRCHSFIRDGRIEFLGDCSHAMKNQTVDLPAIEDPS